MGWGFQFQNEFIDVEKNLYYMKLIKKQTNVMNFHIYSHHECWISERSYSTSFHRKIQWKLFSSKKRWYILFSTGFSKEKIRILKWWKWQVGSLLLKYYPPCTDISSYSFQDRKVLFCKLITHILQVCILHGFWFLIIFVKNTTIEPGDFLLLYR